MFNCRSRHNKASLFKELKDTLKSLPVTAQQRNFDHIFMHIPVFDGTKKDFFEWIERLESAGLQSGSDIHNEALGKINSDKRTCLLGLHMTLLGSSIRKELK